MDVRAKRVESTGPAKTIPAALLTVTLLAALAASLLMAGCGEEKDKGSQANPSGDDTVLTHATPGMAMAGVVDQRARVPRIVDLGRGECVPCKMMAPILEEVAHEYRGRLVVELIDVGEHPQAVSRYGMRVMPTQVFFDQEGNEVWRHEGFLPKEGIIEKLTEMGVRPADD